LDRRLQVAEDGSALVRDEKSTSCGRPLKSPKDALNSIQIIGRLEGIGEVIPAEAARRYHSMPERIGELVVLADRETVFGEPEGELEAPPPTFRTDGSTHVMAVSLVLYNDRRPMPPAQRFQFNLDLTRHPFRTPN
jgi:phosphonoacetate hydrolase